MKNIRWRRVCVFLTAGLFVFFGSGFCDDTCGLVIDEVGKVGIGTAVPACDLHIRADETIVADGDPRRIFLV